jgi:hypothetical protein
MANEGMNLMMHIRLGRLLASISTAAMAVLLISCANDQGPSEPASLPELSGARLPKGLAKCSLASPAFAQATIGPAGGTIKLGKNKFEVPRNALGRNVSISMRVVGDSSRSVVFQPEGLTFLKSATLTLDYKGCSFTAAAQVAYTTNQGVILELLPSADNKLLKSVTAPIWHFSKYAVAY